LEAELLQHPPRRRIVEEVRAFETGQGERAGDVDQGGARLGREAAAPLWAGDPIAELDRAGLPPGEAARADQLRRSGGALEDQLRGQDGIARAREEGLGVAQR